jgi:phosphoribosylglycinamide formyltransferase 1
MKVAILISGGGTTAEAVIKACQSKVLSGIEPVVISSNLQAKGNKRVKTLGADLYILDKDSFTSSEEFGKALYDLLYKLNADLISLQGWLHLIPKKIVQRYENRIINQHPGAIDPGREGFGGAGMSTPYRVNATLLAYNWMTGEEISAESNTHFVTEEFDMGDIIRIEKMKVPTKKKLVCISELRNNPAELIKKTHKVQEKFYPVEYKNVIATLQLFSDGKARGLKRGKPLIPKENIPLLKEAKKLATELFPFINL